jgi:hypothetical protein
MTSSRALQCNLDCYHGYFRLWEKFTEASTVFESFGGINSVKTGDYFSLFGRFAISLFRNSGFIY